LRGKYDRIILDTPPVLGLSETSFLQSHAEGVVLVVRSDSTPRKDVEDAYHALSKLDAHFYGFVLNRVDFSKRANHYYYYYYSSSYYDSNWEKSADTTGDKMANSTGTRI
jgi:succinoglycan biosynthesis transport protein ExoP